MAVGSDRSPRIPTDLWDAILDYRSGRKFIWDEKQHRARAAHPHETSGFLPTTTPTELGVWREKFATLHRRGLAQGELRQLNRWVAEGLPTTSLPPALRRPWNAELVARVITKIEDHFAKRGLTSPITSAAASKRPSTPKVAPSEVAPPPFKTPEITDDELALERRAAGDQLGLGEVLARKFAYVAEDRIDGVFARVVAAWASPVRLIADISRVDELIARFHEFVPDDLGLALIHTLARLQSAKRKEPEAVADLVFRLSEPIATAFGIGHPPPPAALARAAVARLEHASTSLRDAVTSLQSTNTVTAKAASIEVIKAARGLARMVLPAERPIIREFDVLLGAAFRKFCEDCERHDDAGVVRRAAELREHIKRALATGREPRSHSTLWTSIVQAVYRHVEALIEEGAHRSEVAASPLLALVNPQLKLNLGANGRQATFSCRLVNRGEGSALQVTATLGMPDGAGVIEILDPSGPFDISAHSEQLVTFALAVARAASFIEIPITWNCVTSVGRPREFSDQLTLMQQEHEPDWEALYANPPYRLKAINEREHLFGRARVLQDLQLHVSSETSTFLWGQKRVGKTSVLQVLANEIGKRQVTTCLVLRMGQLVGMHEGQLAHTIASRLCDVAGGKIDLPSEPEFGVSIGRLVPFVEKLQRVRPGRYLIIIDEFDDLDPALYLGERGRQLVKGLRSLSEVGLTFFFVGSERMDAIYRRHQADLNKWLNISLDRIESLEDCKALITRPVKDSIEYEPEAVQRIIEYCAGNPFYMQTICFEIFKWCYQERRTFVGESDVIAIANGLVTKLGPTNFAHFWEDNPELDLELRAQQTAANCLLLTCIASLDGEYESIDQLYEVQPKLGLAVGEQATVPELRGIADRLRRRRALEEAENGVCVQPPIFRDWLAEYAEIELLRKWREFRTSRAVSNAGTAPKVVHIDPALFPISEDDLLKVSQRLTYCHKQKDVAELRGWLRQFDDDNRIEVAFQLLQRMAEKGYVSEGERAHALQRIPEVLQAAAGVPIAWRFIRGRRDNLCVAFVDSETKSGGPIAREVGKLMKPAKCARGSEIGSWLHSHADQTDSVLLIVDDFAGTGGTITKGLKRFTTQPSDEVVFGKFCESGRVHIVLLSAFPEAVEAIHKDFPKVKITPLKLFGDEVRALEPEAQIFSDSDELRFAHEVVRQIGQQLQPQTPLGHGHLGALVLLHDTIPNNSLPIFWSSGTVNERPWQPLFDRASWN